MIEESNFTARIIDEDTLEVISHIQPIDEVIPLVEEIIEDEAVILGTSEGGDEVPAADEVVAIDDATFLNYLKDKHGKEFQSIEDVLKEKVTDELPENIQKFLEFQKDTNGRGMEDYLETIKDWSQVSEEDRIKKYLQEQNPDFDADDIAYELEQLVADEEYDTEKEVKQKNRDRKRILSEANKFLEDNKSKYSAPLESNAKAEIPADYQEMKKVLEEMALENAKIEKENTDVRDYFVSETAKVFNSDFKGFEFDLGELKQSYLPTDVQATMNQQSDVSNFITKHIDESGKIKNAAEYHKALTMAMNPDGMAKYFYEKGKSDAIVGVQRDSKNIDMKPRTVGDTSKPTSGFSFKITD